MHAIPYLVSGRESAETRRLLRLDLAVGLDSDVVVGLEGVDFVGGEFGAVVIVIVNLVSLP